MLIVLVQVEVVKVEGNGRLFRLRYSSIHLKRNFKVVLNSLEREIFHLPTVNSRPGLFGDERFLEYFLLPLLFCNALHQLLFTLMLLLLLLLYLDFDPFIGLQVYEWKLTRASQDGELEQVLNDVKVGDEELALLGHLPSCQPHHWVLLQGCASVRRDQHLCYQNRIQFVLFL